MLFESYEEGTMKSNVIAYILTIVFIFSTPLKSFAIAEDKRYGNLDVIYTDNAKVDLGLKVWMIENAKHTVDISSFMFGKDEYGISIVKALRNAANRGVQVRVMYESSTSRTLGDDLFLAVTDLLTDPQLKKVPLVINLGLYEKTKTKLAINDYLHEKLFIVDANQDSEIIYFGGRDLTNFTFLTVDSGYFLRPLFNKYRYVGSDIKQYYNKTWSLLAKHFSLQQGTNEKAQKALKKISKISPVTLNSDEASELNQKTMILSIPPKTNDILYDFQFRPSYSQFVSNDVLERIMNGHYEKKFGIREELLDTDPLLKYLTSLINEAKIISITSYSSDFAPPLSVALAYFLKNNGSLSILTNSRNTMKFMDKVGISEVSYSFSIETLKFIKDIFGKSTKMQAFGLDRDLSLKITKGVQSYLHRKQMLIDDTNVITGSYNFTNSSSTKNNEFVINFYDKKMNAFHTREKMSNLAMFTSLNSDLIAENTEFTEHVKKYILGSFIKSQY